jgi:hypothetical protein
MRREFSSFLLVDFDRFEERFADRVSREKESSRVLQKKVSFPLKKQLYFMSISSKRCYCINMMKKIFDLKQKVGSPN